MAGAARLAAIPLLLAACASAPAGRPSPAPVDDPLAAARAADDAALADGAPSLAPLEGHYLAVAGGSLVGGTLLPEDTAALLAAVVPAPVHAYFFRVGGEGDRRESAPAVYGPRLAGDGLLSALGVAVPPDARTLRVVLEPASGLGRGAVLELLLARGWPGTALVDAEDAGALGLDRSGIPGTVEILELLTGKVLPCRRALVRAAPAPGGEAAPRPPVLVEILYPR